MFFNCLDALEEVDIQSEATAEAAEDEDGPPIDQMLASVAASTRELVEGEPAKGVVDASEGPDLTAKVGNQLLVRVLTLLEFDATGQGWQDSLLDVAIQSMQLLWLMAMRKREKGSVGWERKYKSLQQRWFSMGKASELAKAHRKGSNIGSIIERDVVVTLCAKDEVEHDYVVLGVYNKHYNKWFLMEQDDKEKLESEQKKEDGVRLHVCNTNWTAVEPKFNWKRKLNSLSDSPGGALEDCRIRLGRCSLWGPSRTKMWAKLVANWALSTLK